jgi:predicted nucleic acid-binding protein
LILLDTSGVVAALNRRQPQYGTVRRSLEASRPPLVLSPFVLAEVDYLLAERAGFDTQRIFLLDVASGAYELAPFDAADVAAAVEVIERYSDQKIGVADASIVVLAGRYRTNRVLTLDERHFRALRTPAGGRFTILPADEPT